MKLLSRSRSAFVATLALAALLAGACGSTAPPSASAAASIAATATPQATATATTAPTQTPDPTPSPTEEPTEEPSPSEAANDPTEGLAIGDPYELEPLDAAAAAFFESSIAEGLGSLGGIIEFGAVAVTLEGEDVGIVMAMAFPGFPGVDDPSFFASVMGGVAGSSGGAVEETTIGGRTVALTEGGGTAFAGYQDGDTVIFAVGPTAEDATAIVTALIEANE